MILEPQKIKSDTVSTVSPSISHEVMGPDAMRFRVEAGRPHVLGCTVGGSGNRKAGEFYWVIFNIFPVLRFTNLRDGN